MPGSTDLVVDVHLQSNEDIPRPCIKHSFDRYNELAVFWDPDPTLEKNADLILVLDSRCEKFMIFFSKVKGPGEGTVITYKMFLITQRVLTADKPWYLY